MSPELPDLQIVPITPEMSHKERRPEVWRKEDDEKFIEEQGNIDERRRRGENVWDDPIEEIDSPDPEGGDTPPTKH